MKIELKSVFFDYQNFDNIQKNGAPVLSNISMTVAQGELVGIVGASGSGKTTLVQLLNGILQPTNGNVLLEDREVEYKGESYLKWHRKVGLVSQFPEIQFFENTIFDEIAFGLRNCNVDEQEIEARVNKVLIQLNLQSISPKDTSPFHISEGQKRRIAIASILVMDPEILIFDEPTSALDFSGIKIISELIIRLNKQNRTVIVASHDMDFIYQLVTRVVVLNQGRIIFDGLKKDFFSNAKLLEKSNLKIPRILQLRPF